MRLTFLIVVVFVVDVSPGALDEDASVEVSDGVAVVSAAGVVVEELTSSAGVLVLALALALALSSSEAIVDSELLCARDAGDADGSTESMYVDEQ